TVHYNTFTSSFLQPETAQAAGIVRSKEKGLINVTVIKGVTPVAAQVTGTIKDLGGKSEILTFKQINEKGGISYLAPYSVTQREYKTFTINVETGGKAHGFQFNQELFPAE
ncbi:homoserine acetyltransferase, partial [Pseudomonas fluorescens ABAC62]